MDLAGGASIEEQGCFLKSPHRPSVRRHKEPTLLV